MTSINLKEYKKAYDFAFKLHSKQVRKGNNIPYFTHLSAVSNLIIENGGSTTEAIGGLLHDAVEDQGGLKVLKIIKDKFGKKVATIVDECSDAVTNPKPPWKERKIKYINSIKNKSQSGILVSLCDKIHNANCIISDCRKIGDKLWQRFSAPKKEVFWYYDSLCKEFKKHLKNHSSLVLESELKIQEMKKL